MQPKSLGDRSMGKRKNRKVRNGSAPSADTCLTHSQLLQTPVPVILDGQVDALVPSPKTEQNEFLWKVHGYTNEYVRFADAKASVAIAWASALIGAMVASKCHIRLAPSRFSTANLDPMATFLAFTSLLGFALLASAFITAAWCVLPKLKNKQVPGFIFWESIRAHGTEDSFWNALSGINEEERARHVADHLFTLAGIAKSKYASLQLGLWLAFAGSIPAVIAVLLSD